MRKLALLLLLFSFAISHAQVPKSLDSLNVYLKTKPQDTTYVLALNEYAFIIVQEGKFDEAKKIIAKMDALSNKLNFGLGHYKTMNMKGVVEYSKQNSEKAMQYFLKCNVIIKKYNLPKKIYQNSLNNIGIIYNQMGERENATRYAMALIDFQEKNKLEPLKTFPYDQIGSNLKLYKKYDEALVYFNKTLAIETRYKNFIGMAISENNIGNLYDDLHKNKEAIRHFETGLKYAESINYKLLQTDLLTNLGRMYRNENDYAKAENALRRSEKVCLELGAEGSLKVVYQNLGDLYFFQKKNALAEKYYLKSLAIAKKINQPDNLYSANMALSDLNADKGNYKVAFDYKVAADIAKDSLFKIETAKNTEDMLRKYETEKKEQEIAIQNLQINSYNKQKWFYLFGILALFVIVGLIFRQSRNRKKTNEKLQILNIELDNANKVKARFFSILNHDLRSPVSNLISFLHLQKDSPELLDETSKKRMEDKTISSAENLLESMEDILLWSKGQMENFTPQPKTISVNTLFDDIQKHFSNVENVKILFENPGNESLFTDENYLKTILRNIIGNATKALHKTENATIILTATKNTISISDNGPGGTSDQFRALYDEKEVVGIKTGLGLHLIRDLAKAINCKISVDTNIGSGTIFTILFQ